MSLSHRSLLAAVLLVLPASALAAQLGPSKGSQLVTLLGSGPCPVPGHTGNSQMLSKMVASDGTTVPFTIPPKKILVLSDVLATASGEAAGSLLATLVVVGSAAVGESVAARYDSALPGGGGTASFQFPTGVPVRAGSVACVQMINLTQGGETGLSVHAHGYLAADK